jgi:hypothetical protein
LKHLAKIEEIHRVFGGCFIGMNIRPCGVQGGDAEGYTFGWMVTELAVDTEHVIHIDENPADVLGESA